MDAPAIIKTFLDHVFSGAMDQALELVHPQARFIAASPVPNPENPLHGTFTGVEGARRIFGIFADLLEPGEFTVAASFGDAEHAALYGTLRHTVRATGKPFASDWALICRILEGRIVLYHFYEDTEALQKAMR